MRAFPRVHMTQYVCPGVVRRLGLGALLFVLLLPKQAAAAPIALPTVEGFGVFDFAGTFSADNDVAFLNFSFLGADAVFRAETSSYATGGFDPFLALFNGVTGQIIQFFDPVLGDNRDATAEDIDTDAGDWDARLELTLAPGTYTLALLQYPNTYLDGNLSAFTEDANPAFTLPFALDPACTGFADFTGDCRTGAYALNVQITPEAGAPIPEPGTLTLLGLGASAALAARRRRRNLSRP